MIKYFSGMLACLSQTEQFCICLPGHLEVLSLLLDPAAQKSFSQTKNMEQMASVCYFNSISFQNYPHTKAGHRFWSENQMHATWT